MRRAGLGWSVLFLVALAGCGDDSSGGQSGYYFGPSGSGGGAGGAAGGSGGSGGKGGLFGGNGGGVTAGGAGGALPAGNGGTAGAFPGGSGGSLAGGGSGGGSGGGLTTGGSGGAGGSLSGGSGGSTSGGTGGSLPGGSGGSSGGPAAGGSGGTGGTGGSLPGGSGGTSGSGGTGATGGTGGSGSMTCPPADPPPLPECGTNASRQNALVNCFCDDAGTSSDCRAKYEDCAADPGCSAAVSCVNMGCSVNDCAPLAGSGLSKALALQSCQSQFAGQTCEPNGAGGSAGAGGSGGSGGGSPADCQQCAFTHCQQQSTDCLNDPSCQSCISNPSQSMCATNQNAQVLLLCSCFSCPDACSLYKPYCP